ncbi:MAG: alpha-1,2-fucosyltransferase [Candidatus Saccharimonadales bacterium]
MIVVRIMGGHSNQLFQYAIGRKLANIHNTELVLDLSWFEEAHPDSPRDFEIDCYNLKATTVKNLTKFNVVDPRQGVSKKDALLRKLGLSKKLWMHYEEGQGFHASFKDIPNNSVLIGFWQTEKYFKDLRKELLAEITTTDPLSKKNADYIKKIENCDAVALHFRRGDYVTNENYSKFHGVLGVDYYKKAVKHLQKTTKSKNLKLFIFSNDISWCEKNLTFDLPTTFISGNKKGSDDMNVMRHCKHFVMANSSFSWWGAWLSDHKSKIVVAPKNWFQDRDADNAIDIIPNKWTRL